MGLLSDLVAGRLEDLPEGSLRQADLDTLLVTERIFGPLGAAVQATRFIALATHPDLRQESDRVEILSGLHPDGRTLGTPIALLLRNEDADPGAYKAMEHVYRPSHADFVYDAKYGLRAPSGGGRASARETAARVAAGAVARQVLEHLGVEPGARALAAGQAAGGALGDV